MTDSMSEPSKMKVNMSRNGDGEKPRMVKLGDVCNVVMGQAPRGDTYNDKHVGIPLIAGAGDFKGSRIVPTKYTSKPTKLCAAGDIIVSIRASIGQKVWSDRTYCLGRGVAGIQVMDCSVTDIRYIWHVFSYIEPALISKARGATFVQVNRADVNDLMLPLPSLEEQRRIVTVLDRADAIRVKHHQILADFDELKADMFCNVFGFPRDWPRLWPQTTIGELTESVQYGTSAKAGSDGAWPILRMGNITDDGCLDLTDLKYIDLPESDIQKYTVRIGDMLFNRTNSKEKVGKSCVVSVERDLAFAGYLVRVRFRNPLHAPFVSAFLNSSYGVKLRQRMAKAAVNQANINATEMKNICIPSPSDVALREFARRVEAIAAARAKVERALALDDELFAALQSRAFRGAL